MPALSSSLSSMSIVEGQAFSGSVATFTDANTSASAGDFTALITWGDGSTSAGTIAATGTAGVFSVGDANGGHTFAHAGQTTISVAISGAGGGSTNASGPVLVADALQGLSILTFRPVEGRIRSAAPFAGFSNPNTAVSASDFTASVTWDGRLTVVGTISGSSASGFVVSSPHVFYHAGTHTVSVTVTGAGRHRSSPPAT